MILDKKIIFSTILALSGILLQTCNNKNNSSTSINKPTTSVEVVPDVNDSSSDILPDFDSSSTQDSSSSSTEDTSTDSSLDDHKGGNLPID